MASCSLADRVVIIGSVALEDILRDNCKDPLDLEGFRRYSKKTLVEENVEFWLAVEDFKRCSEKAYWMEATRIFHAYIREKSLQEINIPANIRKMIEGKLLQISQVNFFFSCLFVALTQCNAIQLILVVNFSHFEFNHFLQLIDVNITY